MPILSVASYIKKCKERSDFIKGDIVEKSYFEDEEKYRNYPSEPNHKVYSCQFFCDVRRKRNHFNQSNIVMEFLT